MAYSLLVLSLLTVSASAANVLSPGAVYPVKKERKEAIAPAPAPESFYADMEMNFESYDARDPNLVAMSTRSEQLLKSRRLPKPEVKDPKSPAPERTELTYERMTSTSSVNVPGLKQPFETRVDVGTILASHPIFLSGDKSGPQKVENLAEVRAATLDQAKDTAARSTLNMVLSEDLLLKAGAGVQGSGCLSEVAGKKPGDKWKFSSNEQSAKVDYDCVFDGWAEAMQKAVAVVKIHSNKQRTARQLPSGAPGMAESEGDGVIYFEPRAPETLMKMETHISVEPSDEESARLKAKAQPIPRSRSRMRHWNHVYPL